MKQLPLISVVMPCHNAGRFLRLAVESLLSQTYRHFELIAVNDGSTDNTDDLLREYCSRDSRIVLLQYESQRGIEAALNLGIRQAKGEFIARMDSDDICEPERLEKQCQYMLHHPDVIVCGSSITLIDAQGQVIGCRQYEGSNQDIKKKLLRHNPMAHPTVMIRRKVLEAQTLVYNSAWHCVEDYELWLRLAPFGEFCNLRDPLLRYRISDYSIKSTQTKKMLWNTLRLKFTYRKQMGMVDWVRMALEIVLMAFPAAIIAYLFKAGYQIKRMRAARLKDTSIK